MKLKSCFTGIILSMLTFSSPTLAEQNQPQQAITRFEMKAPSQDAFDLPQVQSYQDQKAVILDPNKLKMLPGAPRTIDWVKYTYISCDVNWDQHCSATYVIDAPAGWQACRALYGVGTQMNRANYSVTPTSWYTNDPESPDRFRAYSFYISAEGSGNIFDRWGSNMTLNGVGLRLIPADATNNDRYSAGCEMPRHD
jgi:hypothetical protein